MDSVCIGGSSDTLAAVIPAFNHSHVLPPFVGERMSSANSSPYVVSSTELVQRFGTGQARNAILDGLFRYRAELRVLGFNDGFQWIDGSFVEDVESRDGRSPNDVDVVTFAQAPSGLTSADVQRMLDANPHVFVKESCKENYRCDTALVNLATSPLSLVRQTRYWYGLYSHRRGDAVWKGMLELPLKSDDEAACFLLRPLKTEGEIHAA